MQAFRVCVLVIGSKTFPLPPQGRACPPHPPHRGGRDGGPGPDDPLHRVPLHRGHQGPCVHHLEGQGGGPNFLCHRKYFQRNNLK